MENVGNLPGVTHLISDTTWISNTDTLLFQWGAQVCPGKQREIIPWVGGLGLLLKIHSSNRVLIWSFISTFQYSSFSVLFFILKFSQNKILILNLIIGFSGPLPQKHKNFSPTELFGCASFRDFLWEWMTMSKGRAVDKAGLANYHFKGIWWEPPRLCTELSFNLEEFYTHLAPKKQLPLDLPLPVHLLLLLLLHFPNL